MTTFNDIGPERRTMGRMRALSGFSLATILSITAVVASAQDAARNIWHDRPRYQISLGSEPGPVAAPFDSYSDRTDFPEGWRLSAQARIAGNWVVGGSYSFHTSRGHLQFADSTFFIPGHWELIFPFFINVWVDPHYGAYGDQVTIDQDVHSYETFGGYTIPGKWPRRRVFATLTALTGVCCMAVKERHQYAFTSSAPGHAVRVDANGLGWMWMLRVRTDLHITKFISLYSEMIISEPIGELHLTSSAAGNNETHSVKGNRPTNTAPFMGFGVALHL